MSMPILEEEGRAAGSVRFGPLRSRRWPLKLGTARPDAASARPDLLVDEGGTAAVEFAMLLPLLCLLTFGSIAIGIGFWSWNILEIVTAQTARCVAIGSSECETAPAGCSGDAGTCFAIRLAAMRGLPRLASNQVIVDDGAVVDGVSYTSVEIDYPFSLLGYSTTLTSRNRFPNPS